MVAAGALAIVAGHLVLAPVTLVVAIALAGAGRASRWRLWWLLVPAAIGLGWGLVIGPGAALAGFAAWGSSILGSVHGHLAGRTVGHPHRAPWLRLPWTALSGQLPIALIGGAAEAGVLGWLAWLHTDEWAVPPPRPGALAAVRGRVAAAAIRGGGVLTRDGCALGVMPATGAIAELRWAEMSGGLLVTGSDARDVALASLQVVHAALRRRKPLIVIDHDDADGSGASAALSRALTAACRATGTPLRTSSPRTDGYSGGTASAGTVTGLGGAGSGMGRASDMADGNAAAAAAAAGDAWAAGATRNAAAAATAAGDACAPAATGNATGAEAAAGDACAPAATGNATGAEAAAGDATGAGNVADARGAALAAVATVAGASGLWGRARRYPPGPPLTDGPGIDLHDAVTERAAVRLPADSAAAAARSCAAVAGVARDLRAIGVDGDGLVWIPRGELIPADALAALLRDASAGGLPVLIGATMPAVAANLAGLTGVTLINRVAEPLLAKRLAELTGARMLPPTVAAALAGELSGREAVPWPSPGNAVPSTEFSPAGFPLSTEFRLTEFQPPSAPKPSSTPQPPSAAAFQPSAAGVASDVAALPGGSAHPPVSPWPGGSARPPVFPWPGGSARPAVSSWPGGPDPVADLVRCPVVPAPALRALGPGEFVLAVNTPSRRLISLGRLVPARLPRQQDLPGNDEPRSPKGLVGRWSAGRREGRALRTAMADWGEVPVRDGPWGGWSLVDGWSAGRRDGLRRAESADRDQLPGEEDPWGPRSPADPRGAGGREALPRRAGSWRWRAREVLAP